MGSKASRSNSNTSPIHTWLSLEWRTLSRFHINDKEIVRLTVGKDATRSTRNEESVFVGLEIVRHFYG